MGRFKLLSNTTKRLAHMEKKVMIWPKKKKPTENVKLRLRFGCKAKCDMLLMITIVYCIEMAALKLDTSKTIRVKWMDSTYRYFWNRMKISFCRHTHTHTSTHWLASNLAMNAMVLFVHGRTDEPTDEGKHTYKHAIKSSTGFNPNDIQRLTCDILLLSLSPLRSHIALRYGSGIAVAWLNFN